MGKTFRSYGYPSLLRETDESQQVAVKRGNIDFFIS